MPRTKSVVQFSDDDNDDKCLSLNVTSRLRRSAGEGGAYERPHSVGQSIGPKIGIDFQADASIERR